MVKEDVLYTCNGMLTIKKNEILPFVSIYMNLEDIRLSEIRKINTVYFHLYVESKK